MIDIDPLKKFDEKWDIIKNTDSTSEAVFEEVPVSFVEFCTSELHMNFPKLSERQQAIADFMFGTTGGLEIFENNNFLAVLCFGKGGFSSKTVIKDVKTGEEHTVEEWARIKKEIYIRVFNRKRNKTQVTEIKPFFKEKSGECYKVATKSGKVFYVDKEHKFLSRNGWKKLEELNVGDKIAKEKQKD